jgi:hypothetical protein
MSEITAPTTAAPTTQPQSRAAQRSVEAGSYVDCTHCGERVKFQAKVRNQQVICNIYTDGRWTRVEHYHAECYEAAGEPFGTPAEQVVRARTFSRAGA